MTEVSKRDSMGRKELQKMCKEKGIRANGRNEELLASLQECDALEASIASCTAQLLSQTVDPTKAAVMQEIEERINAAKEIADMQSQIDNARKTAVTEVRRTCSLQKKLDAHNSKVLEARKGKTKDFSKIHENMFDKMPSIGERKTPRKAATPKKDAAGSSFEVGSFTFNMGAPANAASPKAAVRQAPRPAPKAKTPKKQTPKKSTPKKRETPKAKASASKAAASASTTKPAPSATKTSTTKRLPAPLPRVSMLKPKPASTAPTEGKVQRKGIAGFKFQAPAETSSSIEFSSFAKENEAEPNKRVTRASKQAASANYKKHVGPLRPFEFQAFSGFGSKPQEVPKPKPKFDLKASLKRGGPNLGQKSKLKSFLVTDVKKSQELKQKKSSLPERKPAQKQVKSIAFHSQALRKGNFFGAAADRKAMGIANRRMGVQDKVAAPAPRAMPSLPAGLNISIT